jgi:phosphate transport system substrate-binding protein
MKSHLTRQYGQSLVLLLCSLFVLAACKPKPDTKDNSGPTFGEVVVVADNTLFPIAIAEEDIFEHTYSRAKVDVKYLPEIKAMNYFLQDSAQLILSARALNEQEKAFFAKRKIIPRTNQVATDAVAFMVHRSNRDSSFTCEEILKVLRGDVTSWNQLSPNNSNGKINIVFDNANSSTVTYVMKLIGSTKLPANAFALKDNPAVVDYVATHPGAIGIIGYSWVSDYDDPLAKKLLSSATLVGVAPCSGPKMGEYVKPYATNLIDTLYPFRRNVYVISREGRSGLATGFASFIASDVGQRIIQKAGIPSYYKVEYNIELTSEPFNVEK